MPAPSMPSTFTRKRRAPGLGESVLRPDAPAKTKGQFAFSSDLWMDGMVWGATVRSPHPHARIRSMDTAPALRVAGVHAVITIDAPDAEERLGLWQDSLARQEAQLDAQRAAGEGAGEVLPHVGGGEGGDERRDGAALVAGCAVRLGRVGQGEAADAEMSSKLRPIEAAARRDTGADRGTSAR